MKSAKSLVTKAELASHSAPGSPMLPNQHNVLFRQQTKRSKLSMPYFPYRVSFHHLFSMSGAVCWCGVARERVTLSYALLVSCACILSIPARQCSALHSATQRYTPPPPATSVITAHTTHTSQTPQTVTLIHYTTLH